MLKLHKALVDCERENYVAFNGPVTPTEFLSQLLENPDLAWLRRFSTLLVDIDEMFAQKDGFTEEAIDAHLAAMNSIITISDEAEHFRYKYEIALHSDPDAAALHAELKKVLQA